MTPLKQLRLLFRLGLGGRLGDGSQYMPMVSLRDWVGAVAHLAEHATASGPFNLCCPRHADQRGVHRGAGRASSTGRRFAAVPRRRSSARRRARWRRSSWARSTLRPGRARGVGYAFQDRDVGAVLRAGRRAARRTERPATRRRPGAARRCGWSARRGAAVARTPGPTARPPTSRSVTLSIQVEPVGAPRAARAPGCAARGRPARGQPGAEHRAVAPAGHRARRVERRQAP